MDDVRIINATPAERPPVLTVTTDLDGDSLEHRQMVLNDLVSQGYTIVTTATISHGISQYGSLIIDTLQAFNR